MPTELDITPEESKNMRAVSDAIVSAIVACCERIEDAADSIFFCARDAEGIRNMFSGLNHAVSAYEKVFRMMQSAEDAERPVQHINTSFCTQAGISDADIERLAKEFAHLLDLNEKGGA